LINLKIASATFGIGGGIAPIAFPPGYAPGYVVIIRFCLVFYFVHD